MDVTVITPDAQCAFAKIVVVSNLDVFVITFSEQFVLKNKEKSWVLKHLPEFYGLFC